MESIQEWKVRSKQESERSERNLLQRLLNYRSEAIESIQDHDVRALGQALFLAVTAPSQQEANECMEMAAQFSMTCTAADIEDAKRRVDEAVEPLEGTHYRFW